MNQERNIRLYMFLRLLMLFSVVISAIVYQKNGVFSNDIISKTYFVTFFTFLVTTAFIFLYEKAKDVTYFLSSQVAYDILFTTVLIFYTGPYDSMYVVFYFFNIIFAAILFRGTGALIAALSSGALYVLVTWLNSDFISNEKSFSLLTTLTAFVAIALLSGQLVEELRKSRQRITRLEQLSEEIVESLDSGLIALDASGVVRKINRTGQQLIGAESPEALSGRPLEEILPVLNGINGSEMRELKVQGRMRRMLVTRVELPENNSMILFRDLSEILELEEKLRRHERLAGVGRLATGLAHEIRNPIASISGAAQLLGGTTEDADETRRLTQIIVRESERVDRLVAQLLRFSKPAVVHRETLDLSETVRECVDALKARPDFQDLRVEVEVKLEGPLPTRGNKDELSEVVTNLLVNAIQAFSEQKTNRARKLVVEGRQGENYIELVIEDNGPGIPQQYRSRIFDPFFTTKPTGTGLGLAQVHKIIRDHDGQVDVQSEEGKGTSLKIRLPG